MGSLGGLQGFWVADLGSFVHANLPWIFGAVVIGLSVVVMTWSDRRGKASHRGLAKALGLELSQGDYVSGAVDGIPVEVFRQRIRRTKNHATYAQMVVGPRGGEGVTIGPTRAEEGPRRNALAGVGGAEVQLGLLRFDGRFVLKGEERMVRALLDAEGREVIARAVDEGWDLVRGAWSFVEGGAYISKAEARGRRGLELARWLLKRMENITADPTGALAAVVRNDPEVEVRHRAMWLIADRYAHDESAKTLFGELRDSADPILRYSSLKGLADRDGLLAMVLESEVPGEVRGEALATFATLGDERLVLAVSTLLSERSGPPELRRAAVALLAQRPGEGAENAAIAALEDPSDEVKAAAVAVLTATGTVKAVPALSAVDGSRAVEREAREAVLAIQGRIGSELGGALAMADVEGNLAIAE